MTVKVLTIDGRTLSFENVENVAYENNGQFLVFDGCFGGCKWMEAHNTKNIESFLVIYDTEEEANDT